MTMSAVISNEQHGDRRIIAFPRVRYLLDFSTNAKQISLPPQHAFNSIQPVGGIEMTVAGSSVSFSA